MEQTPTESYHEWVSRDMYVHFFFRFGNKWNISFYRAKNISLTIHWIKVHGVCRALVWHKLTRYISPSRITIAKYYYFGSFFDTYPLCALSVDIVMVLLFCFIIVARLHGNTENSFWILFSYVLIIVIDVFFFIYSFLYSTSTDATADKDEIVW